MQCLTDKERVRLERAGWAFVRLDNGLCDWMKFSGFGKTADVRGGHAWAKDKRES